MHVHEYICMYARSERLWLLVLDHSDHDKVGHQPSKTIPVCGSWCECNTRQQVRLMKVFWFLFRVGLQTKTRQYIHPSSFDVLHY